VGMLAWMIRAETLMGCSASLAYVSTVRSIARTIEWCSRQSGVVNIRMIFERIGIGWIPWLPRSPRCVLFQSS